MRSLAIGLGALLLCTTPSLAQQADRADAERVRAAMRHAWSGYRTHAWGHDELKPLSRTPHDWYATSLLMTPVDAFDTLLLLGLTDEAAEAKRIILERLSFDHDMDVQVFEIVIRLLGGLLSAYQLDGDPAFLRLASDLGDRLLPAFESPTGMPYRYVNLRTGAVSKPVSNPAEIGTLMLEFGTLSKLTGKPVYYERAKRAVTQLYERRSSIGLVGTWIDVTSGQWTDTRSHISGAIDSYYEYLWKAWLLFGDPDFRRMWEESAPAVHRYLADDRFGTLWYGYADMHTGERTATRFGALDAFLPGFLALTGDTARAERVMLSVFRMWSAFGVEPEAMDYSTMKIVNGAYPLRPEAIESAWYLYRLTGNPGYRDMGRTMFDALVASARTESGFASLANVTTGEKKDEMPSFLLAETFKYAWLLATDRDPIDLGTTVFNTEAHPIRRTW